MNATKCAARSVEPVRAGVSGAAVEEGNELPRTYRQPQLVEYGTLADLTRFVGNDVPDGSIGTTQTT